MIHEQEVGLHLLTSTGFDGPIDARLTYSSDDPYVIRLGDLDNSGSSWVLSRNLLWYALEVPGRFRGIGDIQVQTDGDYFRIILDNSSSSASVRMVKYDLIQFMSETLELVPMGDESRIAEVELDDFLATILSEGV